MIWGGPKQKNGLEIMNENKSYRVLSLDGGGMRGLYTASVLQSLIKQYSQSNNETNKDIGKAFDLVVGTSTGGILACALAMGVPLSKIIELYSKKGRKIFTHPVPSGRLKQLFWAFKNKSSAIRSSKALYQELQNIFGDKTMKQLYEERQIALCITAACVEDHTPRIFKTPHEEYNKDDNKKLTDICLATASAPVLFPIANVPLSDNSTYENFVDGSLWANSPVLTAIMEAMFCSKKDQNIEIISIGTCPPPIGQAVLNRRNSNELLKWRGGIDLAEVAMDVQSKASHSVADFLCQQIENSGKNITVHRLTQTIPSVAKAKFLSLDQASEKTCQILQELGEKDGRETYEKIKRKEEINVLKDIFTNLSVLK